MELSGTHFLIFFSINGARRSTAFTFTFTHIHTISQKHVRSILASHTIYRLMAATVNMSESFGFQAEISQLLDLIISEYLLQIFLSSISTISRYFLLQQRDFLARDNLERLRCFG